MSELDSFLNSTEGSVAGISKTVNKSIEYPFIYLTKITNVELAYLAGNKILMQTKPSDEYIQLFLKNENGGYKALGYIRLNFDTIVKLNYLQPHELYLKVSKTVERLIADELLDSLLLTG